MSDEKIRPDESVEDEVEAHGGVNLGGVNLEAAGGVNLAHEEDEEPDVEAHGGVNLGGVNLGGTNAAAGGVNADSSNA